TSLKRLTDAARNLGTDGATNIRAIARSATQRFLDLAGDGGRISNDRYMTYGQFSQVTHLFFYIRKPPMFIRGLGRLCITRRALFVSRLPHGCFFGRYSEERSCRERVWWLVVLVSV